MAVVWFAVGAAWLIMAAIGIFAVIGSTRASRRPPQHGSMRWYPGEGGPPRG